MASVAYSVPTTAGCHCSYFTEGEAAGRRVQCHLPGTDMTAAQEEVYHTPRSIRRGVTAHLAGPHREPQGQLGGGGAGHG